MAKELDVLAVVVVHGRHVGQDLTTVQTDPIESGVREGVSAGCVSRRSKLPYHACGQVSRVVPRQLLGKEVVRARESGNLRELTRVPD